MSVTSNATFVASVMGTPTSTGLAPNSVLRRDASNLIFCVCVQMDEEALLDKLGFQGFHQL